MTRVDYECEVNSRERSRLNRRSRAVDRVGFCNGCTMKLLLVCTLVFAAPLQAQIERLDLSGMSLPELLQVNITGSTLKAETLKTVPSAVTVFTREEIQRTGTGNIAWNRLAALT